MNRQPRPPPLSKSLRTTGGESRAKDTAAPFDFTSIRVRRRSHCPYRPNKRDIRPGVQENISLTINHLSTRQEIHLVKKKETGFASAHLNQTMMKNTLIVALLCGVLALAYAPVSFAADPVPECPAKTTKGTGSE